MVVDPALAGDEIFPERIEVVGPAGSQRPMPVITTRRSQKDGLP